MSLSIKLHPKQVFALTSPANEILYGGAVGGGKALDVDTPILTETGWKTIGTVQEGDKVFDKDGNLVTVLAKSKVDKKSACYEVTFNRGTKLVCDGRHSWEVMKGMRKKPLVMTTLEMKKHRLVNKYGRSLFQIKAAPSLNFPRKRFPVDPYLVGMFCNGGFFKHRKKNLMVQQACAMGSTFQLSEYKGGKYLDPKLFYKHIAKVGLSEENKDIPEMYQYGNREQRLSVLQGILDISGSPELKQSRISIHCRTQQFAEDIVKLVRSLGIRTAVTSSHNDFEFNNYKDDYQVRVRFEGTKEFSRIKQEQDKLPSKRKSVRNKIFYLKTIEKVEKRPLQCLYVDSPSNTYLAGEELVPTHNSFLMRTAAIIWAMEAPGAQIYLFRLTRKELEDNHMIGKGSFHDLLGDAVDSKFVKINNSDYQIQFKNGPNGTFMGGSIIHLCHCQYEKDKYKYQGAEMDVLMIDEATHFTWSKYTYLRTRVRTPETWQPPKAFREKWGENFFPRILLGTNPGGVSHSKMRKEFVKLAPPMTIVKMPKSMGGMRRQFIPATLDDNPSINKDEYEGKVMSVGNAATAKMLLEGDWDAIVGGMFDDVWDPKVHIIEPFEIPASWYVDRAFDWGSAAPFSVGWYAESDGTEVTLKDGSKYTYPAGMLFRIAEWYGWNGEENEGSGLTGYEVGYGIQQMEENNPVFANVKKVYPGPADTQIWNANPKFDSAYGSIAQEINAGYYGKDGYKMFDIFTKSDKSSGSNMRGWEMLRTYLKNSLNYPTMDRKCIFFFNTNTHLARTLPIIMRDENRLGEIMKGQEDHVVDEVKYRVVHTVYRPRKIKTIL